jgi:putative spermidine/putrescine transport system substrate-binding protein
MTSRAEGGAGRCRRVAVVTGFALLAAACGAPTDPSPAAGQITPQRPSSPISLTVLDGGGDLKGGGQAAVDAFVKANPDLVSQVTYQTAAATDVAGKLKAQVSGGSVDTSLVLGGPDVLGSAEALHLLMPQFPAQASSLPDLASIQDAARAAFQKSSGGGGILINYDQNGPFVDYNSSAVPASEAPTTPQALLAWAKAHRGRFSYAQPANSGSGRAFIQALPYMLGDADPADPVNGWAKTWAYLQELGAGVSSYPASSTLLAQQFGAGQLDVIPTIVSHDVSNRKSGTWPANTGIALFQNQNWISDGHFAMIPKGVSAQTLYVDLELESYLVQPEAQRQRLTAGVLTTANKNVTATNSGPAITGFIAQWGRPDFFPTAFTRGAVRTPLTPAAMQKAFDLWERNVGSKVGG